MTQAQLFVPWLQRIRERMFQEAAEAIRRPDYKPRWPLPDECWLKCIRWLRP